MKAKLKGKDEKAALIQKVSRTQERPCRDALKEGSKVRGGNMWRVQRSPECRNTEPNGLL